MAVPQESQPQQKQGKVGASLHLYRQQNANLEKQLLL
jgi:hypothetical protein